VPERIYNPITAMGFWQCLLFSWTTLRGKHCRHPIAVMGVVDTFGQYGLIFIQRSWRNQKAARSEINLVLIIFLNKAKFFLETNF
jgi:hypothetical protein